MRRNRIHFVDKAFLKQAKVKNLFTFLYLKLLTEDQSWSIVRKFGIITSLITYQKISKVYVYQQSRALKIFNPSLAYDDALAVFDIPTLFSKRERLMFETPCTIYAASFILQYI